MWQTAVYFWDWVTKILSFSPWKMPNMTEYNATQNSLEEFFSSQNKFGHHKKVAKESPSIYKSGLGLKAEFRVPTCDSTIALNMLSLNFTLVAWSKSTRETQYYNDAIVWLQIGT